MHVFPSADVECVAADFKAIRLKALNGRFQSARADIHGGDASPLASETLRNGKPDSARGAGHDANPILQPGAQALAL